MHRMHHATMHHTNHTFRILRAPYIMDSYPDSWSRICSRGAPLKWCGVYLGEKFFIRSGPFRRESQQSSRFFFFFFVSHPHGSIFFPIWKHPIFKHGRSHEDGHEFFPLMGPKVLQERFPCRYH